MPRPTKSRTSLPGHGRAAKLVRPHADAEEEGMTMPFETNDIIPVEEFPPTSFASSATSSRPPSKQTKATKQHLKRQALLDKITSSQSPYSKSHQRRLKRASKPENNLVTSLSQVAEVLPEPEVDFESAEAEQDEEDRMQDGPTKGAPWGDRGKGKEKLTAKKRSRVLDAESSRLPAVLTNAEFRKNPFATIRLHTINQMKLEKEKNARQHPTGPGK